MRATRNILIAASAAALLIPAVGSAQNYGGGSGRGSYGQGQYQGQNQTPGQRYGRDQDNRYDESRFLGYPEFANLEVRLQRKIQDGRREGWLTPEQAQRFVDRYKEIRADEGRAFRRYGPNPPRAELDGFRDRILRLDERIDDMRGGRRRY